MLTGGEHGFGPNLCSDQNWNQAVTPADQLQIYMYDVIATILGHGCDEHPFVTASFLFPFEPKFGRNPCSSLMLIQYFSHKHNLQTKCFNKNVFILYIYLTLQFFFCFAYFF